MEADVLSPVTASKPATKGRARPVSGESQT
jgi:hypothetical protein